MVSVIRRKVPFKLVHISRIPPTFFGVYSFWHKRRCIYIGQAKSQPIRDRLYQHFKESHSDRLNDWIMAYGADLTVCYVQLEKRRIDRAERRLIKVKKPFANVVFNPNAKKFK